MKSISLRLTQLHAMRMSERDGDELFLMHNKKRIWPVHQRFFRTKDNVIPVDVELALDGFGWIQIELWEYDHWLSSTHLGTFRMLVDDTTRVSNPYNCELVDKSKSEYARYSLRWEVIAQSQRRSA